MSADKESSQKRWSERIGELGPAWITAIVGLCALFVGGGYAAGHASGAHDPAPQPTVTVTATATATVTSPVTQSQQSPHASRTAKSNDAALGSYTMVRSEWRSAYLRAERLLVSRSSGHLQDR